MYKYIALLNEYVTMHYNLKQAMIIKWLITKVFQRYLQRT